MFARSLVFTCKEDNFQLQLESQGVLADAVMDHFVQFLQGVGYARETIHEAMQEVVDEYNEYLKSCERIKAEPFPPLD